MKIKCTCSKCNGSGIVEQWNDEMHLNGRCFSCDGKGFVMIEEKSFKAREKRNKVKASDKFLKNILVSTRKAVSTCNQRKNCNCAVCIHKNYCNLLDRLLTQENTYSELLLEEKKVNA